MKPRRKYQYFALLLFTSLILLLIKTAKSTSISINLPKQISQRNTIGLETYISEENGYSIKYPLYAELREIEIDRMRGIEILGPKIFIDSWNDYPAYRLRIIIHENPDNLSAKDWAQKRLLKDQNKFNSALHFRHTFKGDAK